MGLRKLTYKYDLSLRQISRFLLLSQEIWHTTSEGIHLHGKKTHEFRKSINIFALYCMNKPYFCRIIFLTDWRHEGLKNTINRLLFYAEHFPWIFGKYHSFYILELMIHLLTEEDFFNIHSDTLLNITPGVWIV